MTIMYMQANPGLQKMIYGAFGLPFGLLMTMVCGADLFTGNTATVTAAVSHHATLHAICLGHATVKHCASVS